MVKSRFQNTLINSTLFIFDIVSLIFSFAVLCLSDYFAHFRQIIRHKYIGFLWFSLEQIKSVDTKNKEGHLCNKFLPNGNNRNRNKRNQFTDKNENRNRSIGKNPDKRKRND